MSLYKQYIIGGGIAGLIASYYSDYKIIDKNPMGQLNLRFVPGVRLIKEDDDAKGFIESLNKRMNLYTKLETKEICVGYENQFFEKVSLTEDFKQKYSMITRGKKEYEKSFLSSGESEYSVFTADGMDPNIFYLKVFQVLYKLLEEQDKIIHDKVVAVNTDMKTLFLDNDGEGTYIDYDDLISTIRMDLLEQMMHNFSGGYTHDYEIFKKHFYKCKYIDNNEQFMDKNMYTYSISNLFTRKTALPDYIVFETAKPLKEIQLVDSYIVGHKVEDKYENIPVQLKQSYNLTSFRDIRLVGRFAQWNHSIKSNELIKNLRFAFE